MNKNAGSEPKKLPISAYIICQNEESNLGNCIESLSQCSEIVIVDSGSTDGTAELVQRYQEDGWPIRFMTESWRGYAAQKQFALEQCRQPWCLSLDADERLCEAFQATLPTLIEAPDHVQGYRLKRRPYLIGYGYTPPGVVEGRILRLIRNGGGAFDLTATVHEGIVLRGEMRDADVGGLLHYRPLSMDEQILKENKYSTLKADGLMQKKRVPRSFRMFASPPTYFLRIYFLNGFWKCGYPGFIHAMTAAVYSFLTESKLYQRHAVLQRSPYDDMDRGVVNDDINRGANETQSTLQRAA